MVIKGLERQRNLKRDYIKNSEMDCPAIEGRRMKTASFMTEGDPDLQSAFTEAGFSINLREAWHRVCGDCRACMPCRVPVERFTPSRTQRKIKNRNEQETEVRRVAVYDLDFAERRKLLAEYASLNKAYMRTRHAGRIHDQGEVIRNYEEKILNRNCTTLEFRRKEDGKLVGVAVLHQSRDGLFGYSFYDPQDSRLSYGTYVVLESIEEVRRQGKAYLYMGPVTNEPSAFAYKASFRPLEIIGKLGWQEVDDVRQHRRHDAVPVATARAYAKRIFE